MNAPSFTYELPGMANARIIRDLAYALDGDRRLGLDIYQPSGLAPGDALPAVIFVHGDAPPERLAGIKNHPQYEMWGRLVAASGMVAVVFEHRSSHGFSRVGAVLDDVRAALALIRERAGEFGIDRARLGIWSCSAGGYLGILAALEPDADYLRCAACYYGILDLELFIERAGGRPDGELARYNPLHLLGSERAATLPLQIVRAGRDYPVFNAAAESFIRAALEHNLNLELINYAAGEHAFDGTDHSATTGWIIQRTLDFLAHHLSA